jgi:mono/diheme cytochrome c family protein
MTAHAIKFFSPMLLALLALLALALLAGCYYDNEEELYPDDPNATCETANVTFSGTVQPIINQNCAYSGCHGGTPPLPGGYNLETYAGVQGIANSGRLLSTIRHESGFSAMPKNLPKLPDCSINQIAAWVSAGAPNN